jgi:hypothetical protein
MLSRVRTLILPAALALLMAAGCSHTPALEDISSPEALKARFNADAGKPRIILLLSPT